MNDNHWEVFCKHQPLFGYILKSTKISSFALDNHLKTFGVIFKHYIHSHARTPTHTHTCKHTINLSIPWALIQGQSLCSATKTKQKEIGCQALMSWVWFECHDIKQTLLIHSLTLLQTLARNRIVLSFTQSLFVIHCLLFVYFGWLPLQIQLLLPLLMMLFVAVVWHSHSHSLETAHPRLHISFFSTPTHHSSIHWQCNSLLFSVATNCFCLCWYFN